MSRAVVYIFFFCLLLDWWKWVRAAVTFKTNSCLEECFLRKSMPHLISNLHTYRLGNQNPWVRNKGLPSRNVAMCTLMCSEHTFVDLIWNKWKDRDLSNTWPCRITMKQMKRQRFVKHGRMSSELIFAFMDLVIYLRAGSAVICFLPRWNGGKREKVFGRKILFHGGPSAGAGCIGSAYTDFIEYSLVEVGTWG